MVTWIARGLPLTLSALFLGAVSMVRADGILEQMQNEVAAIVRANKGGIVSIEDEGAMPSQHRAGGNSDSRYLAEQQALFHRLAALQAQEDGITVQMSQMLLTYKAANPKILALKREKETVVEEIQKLSLDLAKQLQGKRGPNPFDRMNAPKSGSGFSIGNGYIVTTADVVEGMQRPLVITDDGTRLRVKLVGIDTELNLGLLQIPMKASLPALKMGDSDTVEVGYFAIAIGNQAGHANSVALTMVSSVRKDGTFTGERFYPSLIQVAGTIGAGTSGAPILNARGEVVGVIAGVPAGEWTETQIYSDQPVNFMPVPPAGGAAQPRPPGLPNPQPEPLPHASSGRAQAGVPLVFGQGQPPFLPPSGMPVTRVFLRSPVTSAGFAIPINDLQFSIKELMMNGKIVHSWVGVDLRNERKMDGDADIIKVVRLIRIRSVYPDSPAQKGGLQPGDILTGLNGKPVESMSEVHTAFMRLHPAEKLAVTVQRGSATQTVTLNIEARPDKIVLPPGEPKRHPH